MDDKSLAHPAHPSTDHKRILEDAREHPERTYSEHVRAAEEIVAAESYREEIQYLMRAGKL